MGNLNSINVSSAKKTSDYFMGLFGRWKEDRNFCEYEMEIDWCVVLIFVVGLMVKIMGIYAFLTGFLPFVVIVLDDGGSLGGSYVGKLDIEITVSVWMPRKWWKEIFYFILLVLVYIIFGF